MTAPTFQTEAAWPALSGAVAAFAQVLLQCGHDLDGIAIRVPTSLGLQLETDLEELDPESWVAITPGVERYADGHLSRVVLCESVEIYWKTPKGTPG